LILRIVSATIVSAHLTERQIESYVSRRAGVDEILAVAQHLDECDDCRDKAAALVDPGTDDIPHTGGRFAQTFDSVIRPGNQRGRMLLWIIAGVMVLVVVVLMTRSP
jgi:hypothetical protein